MKALPDLPPLAPRTRSRALKWLGWLIIRALGWRVEGEAPNIPRAILVAGPHTSAMDALLGFAAVNALQLRLNILVADKFFVGPLGWILRRLGAIPVHREKPGAMVDSTVRQFAVHDQLAVLMTPEGTRYRAPRLRTGFFHIARQARVPVLPIALHYRQRRLLMGPLLDVQPDEAATLEALCRFFAENGDPRHPERLSLPMAEYLRKVDGGHGPDRPDAADNPLRES